MILGYARVSTDQQASELKTSLQEQERAIRGIGMTLGVAASEVLIFREEGVSGTTPLRQRPAGRDLLAAARAGDFIIASKFDRMFRSTIDALETAEYCKTRKLNLILIDIGLQPVTSDGIGGLFFTIVGAIATFERGRINERMHEGMRAKKARGGAISCHAPYGWTKVGQGAASVLEINDREQKTLRHAYGLHHAGNGIAEVIRRLTLEGYRDRKGSAFRPVQIKRMFATARQLRKEAPQHAAHS